jgi:hypothetical protein
MGPNRYLIESIGRSDSQTQQREFYKALSCKGDSEMICFYETEETPTVQEVCNQ